MNISECCNAKIILTDICSSCKEHSLAFQQCDSVYEIKEVNNGYKTQNDHISLQGKIKLYERIVSKNKKGFRGGASIRLEQLYQRRYKYTKWSKLPYGIRKDIVSPLEEEF